MLGGLQLNDKLLQLSFASAGWFGLGAVVFASFCLLFCLSCLFLLGCCWLASVFLQPICVVLFPSHSMPYAMVVGCYNKILLSKKNNNKVV
jgi:hypothetical protein